MTKYSLETIRDLMGGALPWVETKKVMSSYKDTDRFFMSIAVHQESVAWANRILLPVGESLFIVQSGAGRIMKCRCGHEFGDYRINWKLGAHLFVRRDRESLAEIYPHSDPCDERWMELREFICPGCGTLLEVEACAPGYPILEDFRPDLEGLYRDWLGVPLDTLSDSDS